MFKIQHVSEIQKCFCMPKAQITFIRFCMNRYSWWNKSCDSQKTKCLRDAGHDARTCLAHSGSHACSQNARFQKIY